MHDREPLVAHHLIDGRWSEGAGERCERSNPATGVAVSAVRNATGGDMDEALAAASRAARAWARTPFHERAAVLARAADAVRADRDAMARLMTIEEGKPLAESMVEVERGGAILDYFAAEADRPCGELFASPRRHEDTRVERRPVGVVGLITPWNFPVAIPMWKLAPALVYGNAVVWKPATLVPALSEVMARHLHEAGLPVGVLNLVHCLPEVAGTLVSSSQLDALSFTGSTAVGNSIIAAAASVPTRVQAEMGGKNVVIVLADADLDLAVDALVEGSMGSTGQRCTASERLLVEKTIAPEIVERLRARIEKLRVGDGLEPDIEIGPVATPQARSAIEGRIEAALAGDARLVCRTPLSVDAATAERSGCFVAPTILEITDTHTPVWREEVFGPVLAVRQFNDLGEAIEIANDTPYGLSAAVFTNDSGAAAHTRSELDVGVLHINSATIGADPHVPFGGTRASGFGPKEQGREARDFYTKSMTIYEKWSVPGV